MKQPTKPFALCIDNGEYKASLIPGKVYRLIPDRRAAKDDFVRIIDEYEVALVIQIVFTTLVDDADEIVLCRSAIGNQAVHLSGNE